MAKKITKDPNIKQYKVKCPICECEFEFDTTDASWGLNEVRADEMWAVLSETMTKTDCRIMCPICNTWIENKQTEIPCHDR